MHYNEILMGVNIINKCQNLVISKSGKSHIKIVKFEFEILKLKMCVQIRRQMQTHKLKTNLAFAPFSFKKVWSWVDRWVHGWVGG